MKKYLITAKWIITSWEEEPIKEGVLIVEGDSILDIGKAEELKNRYKDLEEINFSEGLIFPGLVNAHSHISMSIFRGIAEDLPLMTWLRDYIFPVESKLKREWVYWGAKLSLIEMIKSGTTLFCDMYIFEPEVIKATKEAGLRALLGEGLFDFPSPGYGELEKGLALTEELLKAHEKDEFVKIAVSPHTLYTCSPETVKKCISLAEKYGAKLHIHLSESEDEVKEVLSKYGKTPAELLLEIGGVNENLIAVHCVKLRDEEIEAFAKRGASIVHCPESNLKLGSGIAPVVRMLETGVNLALGTDGPASNNDLDMFTEMRTAALLQKGITEDPAIINARQIFKMATFSGAKALGFEKVGKIASGYKADFAVIDLSKEYLIPDYDPFSLIVYAAKSGCVSDLMVNGKFLMRNYQLLTLNEEEIKGKIAEIKREVLSILSKNSPN